jgi:hypothetical protein
MSVGDYFAEGEQLMIRCVFSTFKQLHKWHGIAEDDKSGSSAQESKPLAFSAPVSDSTMQSSRNIRIELIGVNRLDPMLTTS